jgi:uncharacterized protein GlcG (DUF336 family)
MDIAVADGGGNLKTHVRLDGAYIGSIDIAINKAYSAWRFETYRRARTGHPVGRTPVWAQHHQRGTDSDPRRDPRWCATARSGAPWK